MEDVANRRPFGHSNRQGMGIALITLRQLRKRKLVQWTAAYAAVAWVLLQVLSLVGQEFDWPPLILQLITVALGVGLVVTLVVAWYHGDRGSQKVTGSEIAILIVTLALGGGLIWRIAHRSQHAHAQTADVTVPASPAAIPDIAKDPSIAVMPFLDLSQTRDQEYFSDGISEELLNLLAKVPKLRVIARTSSFSFKGKQVAIPDIARSLHVAAVLEGSVQRSGNQMRITVQLIRASDSTQLWSETYDRTLVDVFKVQDEIAATVVAKLQVKLLGAAPTVRPVDSRVYPMILQAKALTDQNTDESSAQAMKFYKQALAIAPDEPRAWSGLGRLYSNGVSDHPGQTRADFDRLSKQALNKAISLDPTDGVSYSRLAIAVELADGDIDGAIRYDERAMELEPTNLSVLGNAAALLRRLGRTSEAIAINQYRTTHDPTNADPFNSLGLNCYFGGRYADAIAAYRTALSLSPGYRNAHATLGMALLLSGGDAAEALREMQAEPMENYRMIGTAMALHTLHRDHEADAALAAAIAKQKSVGVVNIAMVYAYRGESDHAFEWLGKSVPAPEAGQPIHLEPTLYENLGDPMFNSLKQDPRWLPLLRKVGRGPEQLAKFEFKVTLPK